MKSLIVGIDPSTTSTGFAVIDPETRELVFTALLAPDPSLTAGDRIRLIATEIGMLLEGIDPDFEVQVFTENTVMRGKGGATFQRCIGAIHAAVPASMPVGEVQNSTVKKIVGGHGQADKAQVAAGAMKWLASTPESRIEFYARIKNGEWDVTDAAAIAIAGLTRAS